MQNDFIEGSLGTDRGAEIVPTVVKKIKDFDGDLILFTQDTHEDDSYLSTQEGTRLPVKHCIIDTKGWEINGDILKSWQEKDDAMIIDELKNNSITKDTFGAKDLIDILKELAKEDTISKVEICGLCTDICVISNAMLIKAFFPETVIQVDPDCCGGVTKESHESALEAMRNCQIDVL